MLCAVDRGRQAALMVPTEVLAEQHHRTLQALLAPLGVNVLDGLRVELLTSSTTTAARRRILGELLSGDVDLVVGTHALLEEGVRFADLGVVVIDEQHRFGVSHRVRLKEKASEGRPAAREVLPDVLVMTATPIPRSLALTLYGDLDVTVLDELPPGRKPITTQLITPPGARRDRLYAFVREQAAAGFGTYVVCPFVEPSDTLPGHRRRQRAPAPRRGGVPGPRGGARPRPAALGGQGAGDGPLPQPRGAGAGRDDGDRGRGRRAACDRDGDRGRGALRHQPAPPAARPGRARWRAQLLRAVRGVAERADPGGQPAPGRGRGTTDGTAGRRRPADPGEGELFGQAQSGTPDLKLARVQDDAELIAADPRPGPEAVADDPHLEDPRHVAVRAEVERATAAGRRWRRSRRAESVRRVRERFGEEAFAHARQLITSLPGDPLLGDWLTDRPGTGDLSSCRKVKLGPDEITPDGTNLGPSLRLVYRLLPSSTDVQQVEVLCIAPRRDLIAYAVAVARLQSDRPGE
jgi:ATP-dependent DNA helicase RecG